MFKKKGNDFIGQFLDQNSNVLLKIILKSLQHY